MAFLFQMSVLLQYVQIIHLWNHKCVQQQHQDNNKIQKIPISNTSKPESSSTAGVTILAEQIHGEIAKLVGIKYAIAETEQGILDMKQTIEQTITQQEEFVILRQDIALRKGRINRLRLEIEKKKQMLEMETSETQRRREQLQNQMNMFQASKQTLQQQQAKLSEQQKSLIPQLKEQLAVLDAKAKQRQRTIMKQLQIIYPIGFNQKMNCFTINSLPIYKGYVLWWVVSFCSDQLGGDDDTASALGYVAHCVKIISKLYQIPLKFQVFTLASRSFVRDEANDLKVLYVFLFVDHFDLKLTIVSVSCKWETQILQGCFSFEFKYLSCLY